MLNNEKNRINEIDILKAISIIAVVFIHSISTSFAGKELIEKILGDALRFAVPGLLFASGFLFNKNKNDSSKQIVVKFLTRIFPPYLFCSFIVLFFNLPGNLHPLNDLTFNRFLFNITFGNILGVYYYIFVILYLYFFSLLLRKLSNTIIALLWCCSIGTTILFYTNLTLFFPPPQNRFFFYLMRHPIVHILPYLTGWFVSLHYERIIAFIKKRYNVQLIILCLLNICLLTLNQFIKTFAYSQLIIQIQIYCSILFLCVIGKHYFKSNKIIIFLSKNSYGIFLIHFPIVRAVQTFAPEITLNFSMKYSFIAFIAGICGSIIIISIGRKIIGKYSKYLIGA